MLWHVCVLMTVIALAELCVSEIHGSEVVMMNN